MEMEKTYPEYYFWIKLEVNEVIGMNDTLHCFIQKTKTLCVEEFSDLPVYFSTWMQQLVLNSW